MTNTTNSVRPFSVIFASRVHGGDASLLVRAVDADAARAKALREDEPIAAREGYAPLVIRDVKALGDY